jgi:predicted methyltransferase
MVAAMSTTRARLWLCLGVAAGCAAQQAAAPGPPAGGAPVREGGTASAGGTDMATSEKLRAALAGAHRSEANRARDVYRHPVETLSFFGLRDDMTVVELWPGGGWYTEVLGPVLKDRGKLIVTSYDPNGPPEAYNTKRAKELEALIESKRAVVGNVQVAIVAPPDQLELGPPASADVVLTFRNLHNWITGKIADQVLAAAFRVLKPGGVLGVVEHRARPGQDIKSGYVEESVAIALAERAGFRLVARSEINANPKDTKDYPEGVWTLPPTLRLGDRDRAKYLAIGESDRMTLRFVKP